MPAVILTGKEVADAMYASIKDKVKKLDPKLGILQIGDDPMSSAYVRQKIKSCEEIGMRHELIKVSEKIRFDELLTLIEELNRDPDITGFIMQLPLPAHLEKATPQIIRSITPMKDIDGFGAYNLGKIFLSTEFEHLPPATPGGVIQMLTHYGIGIEGKHAVIVGRSNIVGKPLAIMLLNRGATVTICHSQTPNLAAMTIQADILCCAVGSAHLIKAPMVKPGAVVIDIGITKNEEGITGDVDFENVQLIASAITPMPGGVGPTTVASLLRNCVRAKERQLELIHNKKLEEQADD